jgi:beta-glucanase (GH16 family)
MKFHFFILPLCLASSINSQTNTLPQNAISDPKSTLQPVPLAPLSGYKLVWSDEFEGDRLNDSKWSYRTDSKMWSTQLPGNVCLSKGTLKLNLRRQEAGDKHFTGGGVISKQAFRYGYYEARMMVPSGAGWHTTFWMMLHTGKGGTSGAMACQELDVIESDSSNQCSYGVNIHKWKGGHVSFGGRAVSTPCLSEDFHVYGCEFTPSTVTFYFDGQPVQSVDVTKARKKNKDGSNELIDFELGEQNIWLTAIASGLGGTKAVDETKLPAVAEFDYVRFFEKK